jgi:ESS family glutamate:Na+ symporter
VKFWQVDFLFDLMALAGLLAAAAVVRSIVPRMGRLGIPDALFAGLFGLLLGPAVLGWVPFQVENLELVVYHALAIVFIALSLQRPAGTTARAVGQGGAADGLGEGAAAPSRGLDVRSLTFAIPFFAALQGLLGLLLVVSWSLLAGPLHAGFGVLLPLGFNQGPGPALTFGSAWERGEGLVDGAQLGLVIAGAGFLWCVIVGVPLVIFGRARGWHLRRGHADADADATLEPPRDGPRVATVGRMEPLTAQIVAVLAIYAVTWLLLSRATASLADGQRTTAFAFHFLVASGVAMAVRAVVTRLPIESPFDDDLLGRISTTVVDVATCAALAAIVPAVALRWLLPLLVFTTICGIATLAVCLWLVPRAFSTRPFEHAVVLFGTMTGTLPTGLSLLRMLDPDLRGPVARHFVLAATSSTLLALPLFAMLPIPVRGGEQAMSAPVWIGITALAAYAALLFAAWWWWGGLRLSRQEGVSPPPPAMNTSPHALRPPPAAGVRDGDEVR